MNSDQEFEALLKEHERQQDEEERQKEERRKERAAKKAKEAVKQKVKRRKEDGTEADGELEVQVWLNKFRHYFTLGPAKSLRVPFGLVKKFS